MTLEVTILGCGSSSGVPLIGCDCATCSSPNPKNKRSRVSVLLKAQGKQLLIDSSPDLRQQALANNIRHLDAVLYTHDHADHVQGLDDLRSFNYLRGDSLPIHADAPTLKSLTERFGYAFLPKPENIWFRPSLIPHTIPEGEVVQFSAEGVAFTAFHQRHGRGYTLGFRHGDFAYSTDTDGLDGFAFEALAGVRLWVVDCLRYTASHSHSRLEQTLEWISKVKPELAILTHMGHELEYEQLLAELPDGVVPGYDGMMVRL